MTQISHMSDSEGLVQSMLQRLRLQEQRSEQATMTSECIQEADNSDTLASAVSDDQHVPHTKWTGLSPFFKGSTKSLGLRKGTAGQKDNFSFSGINGEFPRWERKQLRFSLVSSLMAEKGNTFFNEAETLNHDTHASPAGETEVGLGSPEIQIQTNAETHETDGIKCDEITAHLTPDPVKQMITVTDSPIWDTITTEDTASSLTDSLSRNSEPADQVVTSKTSNNVRKNKRKWAETKTAKRLTQRIKDKWRDRHPNAEKQHSPTGEKFEEKEHQLHTDEQVSSYKSSEVTENAVLPPPIREAETEVTPPQGYDSMSLSGFCMGFSASLMDEICTGPEWTKFFASSNSLPEFPECPDDQSTNSAKAKPESMQENDATEARVPSIDEIAPDDDQSVDMESSENIVTQLTTSEQVSYNQQSIVEVISDQASTEFNHNESQITTNSLYPSNMDTLNDAQSEAESMSGPDDIKDEQTHMTELDLNQTSASDISPHQTEINTPNLDQTSASYINPHQTKITSPNLDEVTTSEIHAHQIQIILPAPTETNTIDMDPQLPPPTHTDDQSVYVTEESLITEPTLTQPDTNEMMNPYLTETDDQSETEDISPDQSSHTTEPTINSLPGESDVKVPQFLPLLDFSYLEAVDGGRNSSAHEKKRRALHCEERETFIDEDDDGNVLTKSNRKAPLTPPPFPPPLPPSQPVTQRSISLNSDSSLSSLSDIVPKKRRLDSTPRRVRFAEEVVILPSYIQPEVEDWPEPEGIEEDTDELEDPEDMEETTVTEEISKTKEAAEKTPEAQLSLYNWILGITKKNKRKAQI